MSNRKWEVVKIHKEIDTHTVIVVEYIEGLQGYKIICEAGSNRNNEWDTNALLIARAPELQAESDRRLALLKRFDKEMEYLYEMKFVFPASLGDLWTDIVRELAASWRKR